MLRFVLAASLAALVLAGRPLPQAAVVGEWSEPLDWPVIGVHAAVLHTGKVLHFSYPLDAKTDRGVSGSLPDEHHSDQSYRLWLYGGAPPRAPRAALAEDRASDVPIEPSNAWLHDVTTFEGTQLSPPNNAFCAGHSFLPDGRLLVNGGTADPSLFGYVKRSYLFDPLTETFSMAGDMQEVRWYPTTILDQDGSIYTVSGLDRFPVIVITDVVERFEPDSGWSVVAGAEKLRDLYPHLLMLPDGRHLNAGPDPDTWFFDPRAGQWTYAGDFQFGMRYQGSAVLLPPGNDRVLVFGGAPQAAQVFAPSTNTAEILDTSLPQPAWQYVAPMNLARSFAVPVLLPDGKVLVVGGRDTSNTRSGCPGIGGEVLRAEMYDPAADTWTLMARLKRPRLYHSTAVLLPDGRVLASGGDCEYTAEVYSPPYLFRGPRPVIASAPATLRHGEQVSVTFTGANPIGSVALLRPPAVTHANAMDQRLVPVEFVERAPGELALTISSNPAFAPAGWYMLFLVDSDGVPSVAHWVQLLLPPTTPVLSGAPAQVSLAGGSQALALWAGPWSAGELYLLVGSATGTSPGITQGDLTIPLNLDSYFLFTLTYPDTLITGALGTLDGAGLAEADFTLAPGASPGLAGLTLHHAYMLLDPLTLTAKSASNALPVTLGP